MSVNSFGHIFKVTTWGESHGPAIGATVDGCPPGIEINEKLIQKIVDKRKPGQSKFTTQRKESDKVSILSGIFNGQSTGTPIQILINNTDQKWLEIDQEKFSTTFKKSAAKRTKLIGLKRNIKSVNESKK